MADSRCGGGAEGPGCEAPLDPEALRAANINPATGLATDYLNHFNEITMLLGLLPDMPDVLDEVRLWRPSSYEAHFERSGFRAKALAIAAYRAMPPAARHAFERAIGELDAAILATVRALEGAAAQAYAATVAEGEAAIRPLMARASGLIHGVEIDTDLLCADTGAEGLARVPA